MILRGGREPNYDAAGVADACEQSRQADMPCRLMVDASHGNSRKDPANQRLVVEDLAAQFAAGEQRVFGVMIESHLIAGNQALSSDKPLVYGQSITDGCIGWEESVQLLETLAEGTRQRRAKQAA